jgi:acyl-CoA synthetase (AMP-forming)/AMP-acid ligase II
MPPYADRVSGCAKPIEQGSDIGEASTTYASLKSAASRRPDAPAIRSDGATTTYAELAALADADAGRLRALGVEAGDRVVLWLPNGTRWASLFYACARLGAVVVTAGTRLRTLDLIHIVRDAEARVLVYDSQFLGVDYEAMVEQIRRNLGRDLAVQPEIVSVSRTTRSRHHHLDSVTPAALGPAWTDDSAPAVVCYTSGTTGRPKGCVHSHRSLVRNGTIACKLLELGPDDRILCPVPFAHVFGFHMGVLQSALATATLVNAEPYDVGRLLHLAETERVTILYLVPTMARDVVREHRVRPRELTQLRVSLVAGAPITPDLRRAMLDPRSGPGGVLSIVYGCTEAPTLTQLLPSDPALPSLTSVGRATPEVELRVCRPGETDALPDGEVGEILARGYNQMLGYLGDPVATRAKHRDGWMVTGDLGWLDPDGFLHFVGRASEMFLVGGFNVHPREIEGQLEECDGVADAAVLGVPDQRLGSVPAAWVTCSERSLTEEQVLTWSHRHLAGYKRPRYVRIVHSLPRTATGKLSRVKLEQLAHRALPKLDWESADR